MKEEEGKRRRGKKTEERTKGRRKICSIAVYGPLHGMSML